MSLLQQDDKGTITECCSIGDVEFVLKQRDCSPANKQAADKIWQIFQDRQNGGSKLKVVIKVISSTKEMIRAAMSDENQKSDTADLQVVMEKPMVHPPAAGSNATVLGIMTSYTPQPFMFTMGNGELVPGQCNRSTSP